jgi:hypothetical protein
VSAAAGDVPLADLLTEFWSMAGEPDSGDSLAAWSTAGSDTGSGARSTAGSGARPGGDVLGRLGPSGIMVDGVDAADLLKAAYRIFAG